MAQSESSRASAIREQVAASLQQARAALGMQAPDVARARSSLAEARGAFVIVQLKALARFIEELEDLLTDLDETRAASPADAIVVMCRSIETLHGFVESLARGDAYQPLSLFPLYAQLCELRGRPGSEIDLYYPDIVADVSFDHLIGAAGSLATPPAAPTERRSRFQAGLLRFLKGDATGVQQMQTALAGVGALATTPAQRSFWSAAQALLDAVANAGLDSTQSLKRLCARVDLELRQLCESSRRVSEPVMREMLYHLAQAAPVTELVRSAQSTFRLSGSLDHEPVTQQTAPGVDVGQLRSAVSSAQAAWERYAAGESHALDEVCERAADLTEHASALDPRVSELIHALYFLCEFARHWQGPLDLVLAQDIVHGLLLAELLLAGTGPACFDDAAAIVRRTVRRREGQPVVEAVALEPSLVGAAEHLHAAAAELGKLLKSIEQGVETAFADPAKRAELGRLDESFAQLMGVLMLLAPQMAEESRRCQESVHALAQSAQVPDADSWSEAAEKLAALAAQVETIGRMQTRTVEPAPVNPVAESGPMSGETAARDPSEQPEAAQSSTHQDVQPAAEQGPIAFSELLDAPVVDVVAAPVPSTPMVEEEAIAAVEPIPVVSSMPDVLAVEGQIVALGDPMPALPSTLPVPEAMAASAIEDTDDELRQIFLEEAAEVLVTIDTNLRALRTDPAQRASLAEIRRSFHTLKGSSRMAALADFGDTAWCAEKLLNTWLERDQATSDALVDFVAQAADLLSRWVAQLHTGGVTIDPAPVHAVAQALQSGDAVAAVKPAERPMSAPAVAAYAPAAPVALTTIVIGHVVLSAELYQIFIGEAQRHIATLTAHVDTFAASVPDEVVRAAHTLGGIAGTAQMPPLSELGYALEGLLQRIQTRQQPADSAMSELVSRAIGAAAGMVNAISKRELPIADELLTRAVQNALTEGPSNDPSGIDSRVNDETADSSLDLLVLQEAAELDTAITLLSEVPLVVQGPANKSDEVSSVTIVRDAVDERLTALLHTQTHMPTLTRTMATSFGTLTATHAMPTIAPVSVEQPTPPERRRERIADDIDAELLPVFLDEAQALTPEAGQCLQRLRTDAADADAVRSLKRILHTLKGSARMAGAMVAGEAAHSMETRVESLESAGALAGSVEELQSVFDRFGALLDQLRAAPTQGAAEPGKKQKTSEQAAPGAARAALRVRADMIDRLVNQAGEVSVARSRIEGEVRTLRGALSDLTDNVIRLRSQLRDIEIQAETQLQSSVSRDAEARFDPLEFDRFTRFQELTRGMAESVNDVSTLQQALSKAIDQSESALFNQGRLSRELQDGLMSVRMVPFSSLAERLHRVVRQSAKELSKRASLQIVGAQTELDRGVLERMSAPFEHLLRNAVAHGIEHATRRAELGKSEVGEITIELRHDGNEAHIEVRDDGGGLNFDAIRTRALERGLIASDASWSERQLAELIFMPGFSTAADVTLAAGRGVGMDVVKNEVSALGGRIDLEFERDRGMRFIIRLPLALGVKRCLLMEVGSRVYALPVQIVEHVMTFKAELIGDLHETRVAQWQGRRYPFHYLPQLLGASAAAPPARRSVSVLMLRSGTERLALQVDRIVGIQELVSKRLGPQLEALHGINGAAVLGTGQVVLFINPVELALRTAARGGASADEMHGPACSRQQPLMLVVDDSLTVRKVTSRLLMRAGYKVVTAKDGVDALNQLKGTLPDVMLVDIEMPRMDGFELTRQVRANSALAGIPIIMVTSRDAEKHRSYAFELGVNAFLGKPYQEDELLAHIARFLEPSEPARAA